MKDAEISHPFEPIVKGFVEGRLVQNGGLRRGKPIGGRYWEASPRSGEGGFHNRRILQHRPQGHASDIFMIASVYGTIESGFVSLVTEYVIDQNAGVFGGSPGYGQANVADLDSDDDLEGAHSTIPGYA